ncbi:MAG: tetratricopeptide repeat protein [Deltaproteobacteria bacterium]|nr:MAG: tetratricopeptide repeat protein [Deltaproteobacteria bacterium]
MPAVTGVIQQTGHWTTSIRAAVLAAGLGAVAVGIALAAVAARASDADEFYRQGQVLYNAGKLSEAVPLFRQAQRLAPLSSTAMHSIYFEAMGLFRQNHFVEAEKVFRRLLTDFPEAQASAESLYNVGICRARLGDPTGAVEAWEETERRFADTTWGAQARARLAQAAAKETGG